MTTDDARHETEPAEPPNDAFLEQLESLYEVDLGETGMAVAFDPELDAR